jgi:hypothetical protein
MEVPIRGDDLCLVQPYQYTWELCSSLVSNRRWKRSPPEDS